MTSILLRIAVAGVRGWTAAYTWRLEAHARQMRRREIDSDLWECQASGRSDVRLAAEILTRLLRGMPDDIGWRAEQSAAGVRLAHAATGFALAVAVVAILVLGWLGRAQALPGPPPPGRTAGRAVLPPPPPPPPCAPPSAARLPAGPCIRY